MSRELSTHGCQGAIVVSRGGGTYDRFGDVYYLTGHYQAWVYLAENPPMWSGRAHTALVVNHKGESILCVSVAEVDPEVVADEVRPVEKWAEDVARAATELGFDEDQPVALIGADVLPSNLYQALRAQMRSTQLKDDLDILVRQRMIKSPAERTLIRSACDTGRRALDMFVESAKPGNSESRSVAAAGNVILSEGAGIYQIAASSGSQATRYTGRSLPGWSQRNYEPGDFARVDIVLVKEGYLCDFGRTFVVGSPPSADQYRLLEATHSALDSVIDAIRPGTSVTDVVEVGNQALIDSGVAIGDSATAGQPYAAYPPHWGHGLGLGFERPWLTNGEQLVFQEGMYLAVERAVSAVGVGTALPEQNLLVTESGTDILTEGTNGRWS